MKAIFKREFSAYIHSVVGLLFMAVTVFFFGLYGAVYNLASGYPYVSYTLSAILFLFLLTIPILSMRILADEKKQKTDQLILTAPVSVGKIVLGKYFDSCSRNVHISTLFIKIWNSAYGGILCGNIGFCIIWTDLYGSRYSGIQLYRKSGHRSSIVFCNSVYYIYDAGN